MRAFIARIERVNPKLNAIVDVPAGAGIESGEGARPHKSAESPLRRPADRLQGHCARPRASAPRWLADLRDKFRRETTDRRAPVARGAITLGKTNTPEFGARQPDLQRRVRRDAQSLRPTQDLRRLLGGAAVAVASGMLPFADGSRPGRQPAQPGNYCNVVGFRRRRRACPRIRPERWNTLSTLGPMARTVEDTRFLFPRWPGPIPRRRDSREPGRVFLQAAARAVQEKRDRLEPRLGGLPMEPRSTAVLGSSRACSRRSAAVIEDAEPDFSGATEAFETLRASASSKSAPAEAHHATS
jgi:amidase